MILVIIKCGKLLCIHYLSILAGLQGNRSYLIHCLYSKIFWDGIARFIYHASFGDFHLNSHVQMRP